jgi:hypothetical protein
MVTLVSVLVLSAGLVFMADSALAEKDDKDRDSAMGLTGFTQNWDKNLPSASRFTVLKNFGGAAVWDNNTGLVWEQAPNADFHIWADATFYCVAKTVGGTMGWRLPSMVELNSLRDLSLPSPFVPAVFTGVGTSYWSATTVAGSPTEAWLMGFLNGDVFTGHKAFAVRVWCVRGPMNADTY